MQLKFIFIILFCFAELSASSQTRLITCSYEQNPDHSVSIYADSKGYGRYTVKIIFTSLSGYSVGSLVTTVYRDAVNMESVAVTSVSFGRQEIARLLPDKNAPVFMFRYDYQYVPGITLRKSPDTAFTYLLPGSEGSHLHIFRVFSLAEKLAGKTTSEYLGTGFAYKAGDTICAARAGVICYTRDTMQEGERITTIYSAGRNRISIQHKDGSQGIYDILAPVHMLISPGENVYPGQPMAVFDKESDKYEMIFSTFYIDEKALLGYPFYNRASMPPYNVYLPTYFYDEAHHSSVLLELNKDYAVTHPREIIVAELNRREKKKLGYK